MIWRDLALRERTRRSLERARAAGIDVIVVTGRMVRSLRRALDGELADEPVVCYQGAVVAAADGTWLRHEPIPLALALETLGALEEAGYVPNVYVEDELYVATITESSRSYAEFQHLRIHEVGPMEEWLDRPPTKVVAVGDPDALDAIEPGLKERFAGRLHISKSLPHFLEFAAAGVTKGAGMEFLAQHIGFTRDQVVSFGDGENDVELIEWAGYGVAVANAHDRVKAAADWVCPSAEEQGVAQVLDAYLDSLA